MRRQTGCNADRAQGNDNIRRREKITLTVIYILYDDPMAGGEHLEYHQPVTGVVTSAGRDVDDTDGNPADGSESE